MENVGGNLGKGITQLKKGKKSIPRKKRGGGENHQRERPGQFHHGGLRQGKKLPVEQPNARSGVLHGGQTARKKAHRKRNRLDGRLQIRGNLDATIGGTGTK